MGLGSTAKKIQTVTTVVEEIYKKTNEMVDNVVELREEFDTTSARVQRMEKELDEQRAILEAVAESQDVDLDALLEESHAEDGVDGEEESVDESADGSTDESPDDATTRE